MPVYEEHTYRDNRQAASSLKDELNGDEDGTRRRHRERHKYNTEDTHREEDSSAYGAENNDADINAQIHETLADNQTDGHQELNGIAPQAMDTDNAAETTERTGVMSITNDQHTSSNHEQIISWRKMAAHDGPFNEGMKLALEVMHDRCRLQEADWARWERRAPLLTNNQHLQDWIDDAKALRENFKAFVADQLAHIDRI